MLPRRFLALCLFALPLVIACAGGGGGGGTVIRMSEFKFQPDTITVRAGQPVKLTLQNEGTVVHDFHVDDLGVVSPKVQPKQSTNFEFTPSKTGTFKIVCIEPGHQEGGMVGSLTVQ